MCEFSGEGEEVFSRELISGTAQQLRLRLSALGIALYHFTPFIKFRKRSLAESHEQLRSTKTSTDR